jgi:hypothetical protein
MFLTDKKIKLTWQEQNQVCAFVRSQICEYCEENIGAVMKDGCLTVEGESVAFHVEPWGSEGVVTVRVNFEKHGIRSKKDGSLDLATIAQRIRGYAAQEKVQRQNEEHQKNCRAYIEAFLETLGLKSYSYEKNFNIEVKGSSVRLVLAFKADQLEKLRAHIELARKE